MSNCSCREAKLILLRRCLFLECEILITKTCIIPSLKQQKISNSTNFINERPKSNYYNLSRFFFLFVRSIL